MEDEIAISVDNPNIQFGPKHVVKDVSFKVRRGEINGFLGISGAGKTTIVRVLTGQIPTKFWSGDVTVSGTTPDSRKNIVKILSKIGYVPQLEELNLYYELTPYDNVNIFASTYGINGPDARKLADKLFKILDVPLDTINNPVKNMSGGEKKRLSMALGMLNSPEILFLDEPTTGVDASKRYSILSYLKRLNEQTNTTMLIITHDLEAANICDSVSILKDGELIAYAPPQDLIESLPSKGQVARLTFKELNEEMMSVVENIQNVEIVVRTGINTLEIFMNNLSQNLGGLMLKLQELDYEVNEMVRDIASFRTYFQLRILERVTGGLENE